MIWIFLLIILFMVAGCYVSYKEAKVHELHKMRAAFEDRRRELKDLMLTDEVKKDKEVEDIFKGESLGFEKALEALIAEGADKDLVDEIRKDAEALREKIRGLFK